MTPSHNPRTERIMAITALYAKDTAHGIGHIQACDACKRLVWINETTMDFMLKHECPVVCPQCAEKLAKGEV